MNNFTQQKLFSKDDISLETETDVLIKKLEKIQNKKNNYKNIEILENIYESDAEEKPAKKESINKKKKTIFEGIQDFFDTIDKIEHEINKTNNLREGINKKSTDKEGMNKEGMDKEGMNKEGTDKEGMNKEGMDKEGMDKEGMDKEGMDKEGMDKEGMDKMEKINQDDLGIKEPTALTKDDKEAHEVIQKIKDILKFIFAFEPYRYLYNYIVSPLYDKLSYATDSKINWKQTEADKTLITQEFIRLIYVCIGVYISGNWYFMMYHRENNLPNSDNFERYLDNIAKYLSKPMGLSRFDSQLEPVSFLNFLLCDVVRKITNILYSWTTGLIYHIASTIGYRFPGKKMFTEISDTIKYTIENKKFTFIFFTLIIIRYILKYSSNMYDGYLAYKNSFAKIPKQSGNYLLTIILLSLTIGMTPILKIIKFFLGIETTFIREVLSFIKEAEEFMKTMGNISMLGPIIYFIIWLIALAINIMMRRFAGLICIIYIYLYSYFGAQLRGGDPYALEKMFNKLKKDDPCENSDKNQVLNLIKMFLSFIYENLTVILVVVYSSFTIFKLNKEIFNKKIAGFAISFNMIVIVLAIIIGIRNSYLKPIDIEDYNYIDTKLTT